MSNVMNKFIRLYNIIMKKQKELQHTGTNLEKKIKDEKINNKVKKPHFRNVPEQLLEY